MKPMIAIGISIGIAFALLGIIVFYHIIKFTILLLLFVICVGIVSYVLISLAWKFKSVLKK